MKNYDEAKMLALIMEIVNKERKNLRSKAHSDQKMSEELQRTIISYSKTTF